ncbi:acyltransferase family protein [Derxia lacustris]|uniref:acyltransferase family protein n=1 Tax=Derxia lacustris TaxID=764842 RepID=UPI0015933342|nr:acyltransferase [Derxia lacustris]
MHGFRGICVLAVFVFHVVNSGLPPEPGTAFGQWLFWLAHGMRYGVELFFMISGYVIVQSLRRHATVRAFLVDRVLRIFPLWLPLAVVMLFGQWLYAQYGGGPPAKALGSLPVLLGSLAIMAPVFPLVTIHPAQWSLSYELCFYLFASLAWVIGGRKSSGWRLALCWLPALVFPVLYPRALFFAPGVIVALAEPWLVRHAQLFKWGWAGVFVAWYAWLLTDAEVAGPSLTLIDYAANGLGPAVLAAFVGAFFFFAWLVVHRRDSGRFLKSRALQWLGTISFSFYLVHPLAMPVIKRGLLPLLHLQGWPAVLLFAVLAFPLACAASWVTWRWLEGALSRRLKGLIGSKRQHEPAVPAVAAESRQG